MNLCKSFIPNKGFKKNFTKFFRQYKNLEENTFALGVLFLASAPFIASILLIYPMTIGLFKRRFEILKDKYNYPLIIASAVMIIKCVKENYYPSLSDPAWTNDLNWIGILNWLPLFLCYVGFQPYLSNIKQRLLTAKLFLIGTIPVLISGISQYFFNVYGPFQTMRGLIIWYQRPIDFDNGSGLTSLFNNPNYTGTWLTMIWPFCLAFLLINKRNINKKRFTVNLIISFLFILCTVLTNSRGAWLNLVIPIPIVLGKITLIWLIPLLILLLTSIAFTFIPIIPIEIQKIFQTIVPQKIWIKFSEISINLLNFPRLRIWNSAIGFICKKPFLGWGAASFPILFATSTGLFNNHSHNLFLELSLNYGLLSSILIFSNIILLIYYSFKKIFKDKKSKKAIIDKAWWCAALIFLISHTYDILYYDLRISISSWIFLAGLRCIIYK